MLELVPEFWATRKGKKLNVNVRYSGWFWFSSFAYQREVQNIIQPWPASNPQRQQFQNEHCQIHVHQKVKTWTWTQLLKKPQLVTNLTDFFQHTTLQCHRLPPGSVSSAYTTQLAAIEPWSATSSLNRENAFGKRSPDIHLPNGMPASLITHLLPLHS